MKLYNLLLDGRLIGTTELEKADAPMGVVFGKIKFIDGSFGYDLLKEHCQTNGIQVVTDQTDEKLIVTAYIPNLNVVSQNNNQIKGQGTYIEGMDIEGFEVIIFGIPYPFFEDEFPHHVKAYGDQFKE